MAEQTLIDGVNFGVDLVNFAVDAVEEFSVAVVVVVVLAAGAFDEDGENTTGGEDGEQQCEGVGVHWATACKSTITSHADLTKIWNWPLWSGTHDVLQMLPVSP